MIKKILKIALIIVVLAILAALDVWMVWKYSLPPWLGAAVFAGVIGIFIGIIFLKKYLLRRREKKFVQRVVQLDESVIKGAPLHERQQLQDLQDNWKESIALLKRSALKKHGNPLYALPWYMVIGESGSGKTTAIRNSRLDSPVDYPDRAATISATINCDWWFFENSIVLDTAGRYTIPLDEVPDREEWEKFLTLLAKYRRREPVNGIIATVPADKLLASDRSVLREDGQNIRKRIDQLMRVVGARFPVYILVTKMDRVYGFDDIFEDLSPEDAGQAMGYINRDTKAHWDMLLDDVLEHVSGHIGDLTLNTVRRKAGARPGTLVFREEFLRLRPGLYEFFRAVFGDNPYQETPLLRGVFFTSGRQDGIAASDFLTTAGITVEPPAGQGRERGMFLRDIFSRILPSDRSLYTHTRDFLRWKRITRSLAFLSWTFIWVGLIGLLTFSFLHNMNTLNNFTDVFKKLPALPGDPAQNLLTIEKFRIEIEELERNNARWFLPRFCLDESRIAEKKAQEHYITFVNKGFLWNFDKALSDKLSTVTGETDPDLIATYANYLMIRTALLNGILDKGKIPDVKGFGEASAAAIDLYYGNLPYEASQIFGNIYRDYLRWHTNRSELARNRELVQVALVVLVTKHGRMEWLVHKSIPDAPDVKLADFWGNAEVGEHDDLFVSGAYTKLGQKHIATFITSLEDVLKKDNAVTRLVPPFWKWYQEEYYKAWYEFADNFHKGADAFQTETAQRNMAALMSTDHNPYWKLIHKLDQEAIQSDPNAKPPKWTRLPSELVSIARLITLTGDDKTKKDQTFREKIGARIKKAETEAGQEMAKLDPAAQRLAEQRPSRAKVFTEYVKALTQTTSVASSGDTAFKMISDLFSGQAALAEDKSPFNQAYSQLLSLKNMMKEDDYGDADVVWSLMGGPLNYLVTYGVAKASCSLQDKWEGDVVGKMDGVPKEKVLKALFDKSEGVLVKYRDETAKPFLVSGKLGYDARKAYEDTLFETSIPFKPEFLKFLNAAPSASVEFQSDFVVPVQTVPIEVNADAAVRPTGNVLSLQCSDGTAVLKNLNYPDSRSFTWSQEKCGDTVLKITFPDFTLTKIYKGKTAFAAFLSDFSSGAKVYKAADFPDHRLALGKANVTWIKVRYKIDNAQPVILGLKKSSKKAPSVAVECSFK